jgi:hypothetical protein
MTVSAQPVPSGAIPRDAPAAAPVLYDADFASAASLIADPTRAAILRSLLPGRPLAAGAGTLGSFGLDVGAIRRSRRRFAGMCIDWTQRRGHLNGALAAAITTRLFEVGWIERGQRSRSVRITKAGADGLAATFGLSLPAG